MHIATDDSNLWKKMKQCHQMWTCTGNKAWMIADGMLGWLYLTLFPSHWNFLLVLWRKRKQSLVFSKCIDGQDPFLDPSWPDHRSSVLNQIESFVYRGGRNLNLVAAVCQVYSHFSSGNWLSPAHWQWVRGNLFCFQLASLWLYSSRV